MWEDEKDNEKRLEVAGERFTTVRGPKWDPETRT